MKKSILLGLCLTASLSLSGMAWGQGRPPGGGPGGGQGGMHGPQRPPQAALDACQDKSSGDACSFEISDETISGTCFAPQEDLPLACRPKNPPRR